MVTHIKTTFDNNIISFRQRIIPIVSDLFFEKIKEWNEICQNSPEYAQTLGQFVFPTSRSEQITPNGMSQRLADFADWAGISDIRKFTSHICRHTAATNMYRSGTDVLSVARILGHSDKTVTSGYIHTDLDDKRNAVRASHQNLDKILKSVG